MGSPRAPKSDFTLETRPGRDPAMHSGIDLEISAYSPFLRDDEAITPLIVHL